MHVYYKVGTLKEERERIRKERVAEPRTQPSASLSSRQSVLPSSQPSRGRSSQSLETICTEEPLPSIPSEKKSTQEKSNEEQPKPVVDLKSVEPTESSKVLIVKSSEAKKPQPLVRSSAETIRKKEVEKPKFYFTNRKEGKPQSSIYDVPIGESTSAQEQQESSSHNFVDLEQRTIGVTIFRENEFNREDYILMGDSTFIGDIRFDFTYSKKRSPIIRATAYLTDLGRDNLRSYMRTQVRRKEKRSKRNKVATKSITGKRMGSKNTIPILVKGVRAHLNNGGKIEVFSPYEGLNALITGYHNGSEGIFAQHTEYARCKKWVHSTNQDFNNQIGEVMKNLAIAIDEVFKTYSRF